MANDVRRTETRTAQPPLSEPRTSEPEMNTEKLKRFKQPGTDRITADSIEGGNSTVGSQIHELMISSSN